MPPKRSTKAVSSKPKATPAASTRKAPATATAKRAAARQIARDAKGTKSSAAAASTSRSNVASRTGTRRPAPKAARKAQPKTTKKKTNTNVCTSAHAAKRRRSGVQEKRTSDDENDLVEGVDLGSDTTEGERLGSSAMRTPVEISDSNDESDGGDEGQSRSSSPHAERCDAHKAHHTSSPLEPERANVVPRQELLSTPLKAGAAITHFAPHNEEVVSPQRDTSPEALTADSESKRSCHRWQQHLLSNSSRSATQLLRDEDDADAKTEDAEEGAEKDRGKRTTSLGQRQHPEMAGSELNVPAASLAPVEDQSGLEHETVKRLFTQPQRGISYSPLSSRASSLSASSSSSLTFVGHAGDRTLPMHDPEDDDDEKTTKLLAPEQKPVFSGSRRHAQRQRKGVSSGVGPTVNNNKNNNSGSSFSSSSSSSLDSSVFHEVPLPSSPTADTPPPPTRLTTTSETKEGAPLWASFTKRPEIYPSREVHTPATQGGAQRQPSDEVTLLAGPTRFSDFQAGSSTSSAPLLSPQQDQEDPHKSAASPSHQLHAQQLTEVQNGMAHVRQNVSPSPLPKAEGAVLIESTAANTGSANYASQHVPHSVQQQQQLDIASVSSRLLTQAQTQISAPAPSGHLRMGGGGGGASLGRGRSPSNTSPPRPVYGWLKKVNAGVQTRPLSLHPTEHVKQHDRLSMPATAGVFPTHPLSTAQQDDSQQEQQQQANASLQLSTSGVLTSYTTPPTSRSAWGASAGTAVFDGDGVGTEGNSLSCSSSGSPLRLRQREPPAWRSPQPSHFPKSLNVSPSSVQPRPMTSASTTTLRGHSPPSSGTGGRAMPPVNDAATSLSFPSVSQTVSLSALASAVLPGSGGGARDGPGEHRSRSNSSSASTAVLTQTYVHAAAESLSLDGAARAAASAQISHAASSAGAPSAHTAAANHGSVATSRLSTQLITKAAATRPVASPATMWICLDDDDDGDSDEEGDAERMSDGESAEAVRSSSGGEAEEEAEDKTQKLRSADRVGELHTGSGDVRVSVERSGTVVALNMSATELQQQQQQQPRKSSPSRRRPAEQSHPIAEILSPTFRPRRRAPQPLPFSFVDSARRESATGSEDTGSINISTDEKTYNEHHLQQQKQQQLQGVSAETDTAKSALAWRDDPRRAFIQLDDDSDDDDGEDEEEHEEEGSDSPPHKRARLSAPYSPFESPIKATPAAASLVSSPSGASPEKLKREYRSFVPLIVNDDSDEDDAKATNNEEEKSDKAERKSGAQVKDAPNKSQAYCHSQELSGKEGEGHVTPEKTKAGRVSLPQRPSRLSITLPSESDDSQGTSPLKPTVRDLFFPKRLDPEVRPCSPLYESIHAYQQHYQQQQQQRSGEDASKKFKTDGVRSAFRNSEADVSYDALVKSNSKNNRNGEVNQRASAAFQDSPGHKRGRPPPLESRNSGNLNVNNKKRTSGTKASLVPALPDWGRPADTLLRDFFPTKFTKKNFMEAAQKVMSPMHFLEAHDFWEAFTSAEFVGEGSFGLVWRCRTVDGDLVAVKSCPIILRTKANIEDSFSTIREIATMRFLNEMQVPYILPLHSAFYVKASEAMPPLAQEALAWRQQLRKEAEAAVLEKEVKLLSKGHASLSKRGGGAHATRRARGGMEAQAEDVTSADAPLTFEEQVEQEMRRREAAESRAAKAVRARLQHVRLPRFLSITEDDLRQSDATAFLVMELCDGDVEGIPRSDGVAKGVVYCVSSALAAMHELGLLHLDLKPSNVLFAYEHGPSQVVAPSAGAALTTNGATARSSTQSATPHTMDAVKFYLSDFGNCRLVGPNPLDEVRESYGTFEYMDLPALQDAVCGRPTDAFSLGATLYELLYGKRLYPKCTNPKCMEDEDHSRSCFVDAAKRAVVLPPSLPSSGGLPGHGAGAVTASTTATTTTVSTGSPTFAEIHSTSFANVKPSFARCAAMSHNLSDIHNNNDSGKGQMARMKKSSAKGPLTASVALTPLQTLTLALLRKKWSERMTAAECRRFLIDTFNITQADNSLENEGEDGEEAAEGPFNGRT